MQFLDLAKLRFSSRKYLSKPVEEDKLIKVLEAARIAPSAANRQPCTFHVIRNDEKRQQISQIYQREWFKDAPVIIIITVDRTAAWVRADNKNHGDIDAAIAVDHMTLQATELGLGTCWICNFDASKCRQILQLDDQTDPVVVLTLAYPTDAPNPERHITMRKPLSDIVKWE